MTTTQKTKPNELSRKELEQLADELRYVITDMICRSGSGHLGGALSLVDILLTLYYRVMKIDPDNPAWKDRDRLVLSKGHAAPVLYAVLAYRGFFPKSLLGTLNADGTTLPSHADARTVPGIDMTTGSLGQGLSAACGMALAAKKEARINHVYCIIGDGETNEGQNWEAAMFAAHHKLDNLTAVTDYNKLQIDGFTADVLDIEPLAEKWRAFGWNVLEMFGHEQNKIYGTFLHAKSLRNGKPTMIIAHTIKAYGCKIIENTAGSHNIKIPDAKAHHQYLAAFPSGPFELPY
ncbi:MAG: transketolase [Planctomycetaceae bacterium]|jgi:transketolase|nr:transketolase [Planctomycetaceae bacterium]